jgi:hypothetical protein
MGIYDKNAVTQGNTLTVLDSVWYKTPVDCRRVAQWESTTLTL